jgi:hypothetical protein
MVVTPFLLHSTSTHTNCCGVDVFFLKQLSVGLRSGTIQWYHSNGCRRNRGDGDTGYLESRQERNDKVVVATSTFFFF